MGSLSSNYVENSPPENKFQGLDHEEFRKKAHQMVDYITDYYKNIEKYPVLSQVEPGYLLKTLPETAPFQAEPFETILGDVSKYIVPGLTHWLSPNFFAFFPATVSSAAFVGEMLSTSFNCVGFNWLASPAATELEMIVMDWLASMLKLPTSFMFSGTGGGVLHGTTSEAMICTLVAARDRVMESMSVNDASKLVVYASDQTHSSFTKASKLVGISPSNIRLVPTALKAKFAMSPSDLRRCIQADVDAGLVPLYVCVTVGTTSTGAVDPVADIADVAGDFNIWVHIDAAYGGNACICPEFRHYFNGVEKVDSLGLAPHKWLLSYLECCCLWVKSPHLLTNAFHTNPEYLKNKPSESKSVVDYKDWQIGTGRKFKSLRLWLVLRSYGVENIQDHIRSDVKMARKFEGMVKFDSRFEIIVPRNFALVCFRLNPKGVEPMKTEALNRELLNRVNSTGKVYMTHTIVGGIYIIRFAVGSTLTEDRHVEAAWLLVKEEADALLLNIQTNGNGHVQ